MRVMGHRPGTDRIEQEGIRLRTSISKNQCACEAPHPDTVIRSPTPLLGTNPLWEPYMTQLGARVIRIDLTYA